MEDMEMVLALVKLLVYNVYVILPYFFLLSHIFVTFAPISGTPPLFSGGVSKMKWGVRVYGK